jgi:hypothetical protein
MKTLASLDRKLAAEATEFQSKGMSFSVCRAVTTKYQRLDPFFFFKKRFIYSPVLKVQEHSTSI